MTSRFRRRQAGIKKPFAVNRAAENSLRVLQSFPGHRHSDRVYIVDNNDIAHQGEIVIQNEVDDLFVVEKVVRPDDKIVIGSERFAMARR
jgi:SOS-response transcriptional repressor LexA